MALFAVVGVVFVSGTLLLSELLSPKKPNDIKLLPYECGMEPVGDGATQFNIRYYVFAILFVAFDVEAIFLYPWAVVLRKLGVNGFLEMLLFIAVLVAGLLYVWKKGALKWI